jgi:transposase
VKVLYWDRDGFCLWQKRLSRGTIRWPRDEAEVRKIGYGDLSLLLSGMDLPMGMEEDMPAENSAWW